MSHIPERNEKNCLNCGTIVQGRYCQQCGQENVEAKETFWHMVTHFFYDLTHFDSNFFHTIHHLVLKPGFLSREYIEGKRASYLHPIRMYVFTSAIFFLLFFNFFSSKTEFKSANTPLTIEERKEYKELLKKKMDEEPFNANWQSKWICVPDTSCKLTRSDLNEVRNRSKGISLGKRDYKSLAEYDSIETSIPPNKRDGWLEKRIKKRILQVQDKFREDPDEAGKELTESILHRLPYMLFVSLPLFALILKLVYIRRKKFLFFEHGVFTIHLYVFTFLLLLLLFTIGSFQTKANWVFLNIVYAVLFFILFGYLLIGMKKFYEQGWWKTFFKFLMVSVLSLVMMFILFIFFAIFSAITL